MNDNKICIDIERLKDFKVATEHVCQECIKSGSSWLHLRTCQSCGVTLCCDSSPNKHMTAHYHATAHPTITSAEEGERWIWCYEHQVFVDY